MVFVSLRRLAGATFFCATALAANVALAAGAHSCAGMSKTSFSPSDFKFVPAGTCNSIKVKGHRGSLTAA